jgi:hypothetical protein
MIRFTGRRWTSLHKSPLGCGTIWMQAGGLLGLIRDELLESVRNV